MERKTKRGKEVIEQQKKDFIKELKINNGFVQKACTKLGISPSDIKRWQRIDDKFAKQLLEVDEVTNEFVESEFFKKISLGDTQSILFYLKTRMRNKYTDVKTVEVKDLDFNFKFGNEESKK